MPIICLIYIKKEHNEIQWAMIAGLRHRLIHDYDGTNWNIIADVVFEELSGLTYDFNMEYGLDIKPIVKNEEHFEKWVSAYPFYSNISKEGVKL